MSAYLTALFAHFLGLAGLFVGYGLEWTASSLLRGATTSDEARSWLRLYRLSLPISGPGLLILIISGGYMASISGAMKTGWISASLLAILLVIIIGFAMLLPRVKRIRSALPEGSAHLPAAALAGVWDPMLPTLIRTRFLLVIAVVYLMTAKPASLSTSLLILLGAAVIGLISAAPVWTSKPKAS